ncbi:DUF1214 domain-containing protein [Echinicola strongylocentroti]|nr:DUF1214 domain-containing protein [Echinicola strongylocentroti]
MKRIIILFFLVWGTVSVQAQEAVKPYRVTEYIQWYPAIKQAEMRDKWLEDYEYGEWQFTGMVTAKDRTVVTPQADVNYGYSWFNISNEPVVITMPDYDKYYSLSIFDMNHYMEVRVKPDKPVVVRLPHQKSPIKDAHEVVLQTYQGLAFTRQVIVNNAEEVMGLAKKITITGGNGDYPFIIPDFTKEEAAAGLAEIKTAAASLEGGTKLFGSVYEGVGNLDRALGVFYGQLGTQARYANYQLYATDANGQPLSGNKSYEITIPSSGMIKNENGYWSITVYNAADKYLIPNQKEVYNASSYSSSTNADGSVTVRINPEGNGANAIPTESQNWYCVLRVYEPTDNIQFPDMTTLK